uniref:Uncharacterized protein n=1 Tax=Nelumbo nucifera TaxID=4432 RepID=A0A822ZUC9_NELNU|nr:TPA_asm: hypothetical protein HUJ06_003728 [Nelumbo nucifera]
MASVLKTMLGANVALALGIGAIYFLFPVSPGIPKSAHFFYDLHSVVGLIM